MVGRRLAVYAALAVLAAAFVSIGRESQYVFQPDALQRLAQEAIRAHPGGNATAVIRATVQRMIQCGARVHACMRANE